MLCRACVKKNRASSGVPGTPYLIHPWRWAAERRSADLTVDSGEAHSDYRPDPRLRLHGFATGFGGVQ